MPVTQGRWSHQIAIASRIRQYRRLWCAADMGTGKSLAALDGLRDDRVILVICPVAVGPAWVAQVERWDPDRKVFAAFDGTAIKRYAALQAGLAHDGRVLIVTNYDWFWRGLPMKALLSQALKIDAIVADESHRIKSPSARNSRALHQLASAAKRAARVCLTGTPMPLGPQDAYGQMRFLDDTVFGTNYRAFLSRFFFTDPVYPSRILGRRNETEFQRLLKPLFLRVKADDVLDLPPAMHEVIPVELPPEVAEKYAQVEKQIRVEIQNGECDLSNGMVRLLRLQQATSSYLGTDLGERSLEEIPAKFRAIEDRLADLDQSEPIAIFAVFRHDLAQARALAARIGRVYSEVSGSEKSLAEFQAGRSNFIALQIQSGGAGIDLTKCGDRPCRYVFYVSTGFNGGDYEQSLARVRRPGQTSAWVRYYHLVARGTIDEVVAKSLEGKRRVVEDVLSALSHGREVSRAG